MKRSALTVLTLVAVMLGVPAPASDPPLTR